ncbi:oligopeptide/dipeptide ABC transporter ATP-binding protein [Aneurinibacillus terranovensis]|uniref:oligopeptide/dipeptide ABC transporter ATP-binding protein n=1 Tax=Aneurinibacillus terranovensis TaxID=278991 RepID=UPI0004040C8F|nr:ABC transporter ATP-binding protein [Aneurinibacillus terranovensis]
MGPLIQIQQLHKQYSTKNHILHAVKNASLTIGKGESFGLVGESGSGKSTLGKMLIGLESPTAGDINYAGGPLWKNGRFVNPRAGDIQIVFQDPQSSLDPRMTVKDIIREPLYALPESERKEKGSPARLQLLIRRVGLKEDHLSRYPHEFSGGQRQRIAIARALITDPSFLILDEPTSALDVSVQAQVLNLLKELKRERNLTYLFISHNMSVIRYMCERMAVMYKGHIVETGPSQSMFKQPVHPYTKILLSSLPSVHEETSNGMGFAEPAPMMKESCVFYEKCPARWDKCRHAAPETECLENGHQISCHFKEVSVHV